VQHASLVIGQHQANQRSGAGAQGGVKCCQIQRAVLAHRQDLTVRTGGAHGIVFGGTVKDAPAPPESANRHGVCLGTAGTEHDIGGGTAIGGADLGAGLFQQPARGAAGGVDAGRVAGDVQRREHRRAGLGS